MVAFEEVEVVRHYQDSCMNFSTVNELYLQSLSYTSFPFGNGAVKLSYMFRYIKLFRLFVKGLVSIGLLDGFFHWLGSILGV